MLRFFDRLSKLFYILLFVIIHNFVFNLQSVYSCQLLNPLLTKQRNIRSHARFIILFNKSKGGWSYPLLRKKEDSFSNIYIILILI